MRVITKSTANLIPILMIFLMVRAASAQVIFSDSFDNSPDWQSKQTVAKSVGGQDRAWPTTYNKACTTLCPPQGWTAYRASASHFTDTPGADTYLLSASGKRGVNGKGITLNVESTSGYGDWAGGSLDISLGATGHNEIYARYWLKYDPYWVWTDPSSTQHSQQKLIRLSRFTGDITNYYNDNPQMYFSPTQNGPSWMPDWYYNKSYGTTSFFSSEFFNVQPTGSIGYGPTQTYASFKWPSDGKWHSYEFRVKMNSAPGVADGEWEMWIDGQNTPENHAVKKNVLWVDSTGSVTPGWNYLMFLDNITVAPAPVSAKKEMQILMDDVVVSTHYSGPPAQPAALTATALSGGSVKLSWNPGVNGAAYLVDGYHIYYGTDPNNLDSRIDVGNVLQYELTSLAPSTRYYFAVSGFNKAAYDTNENEGLRSIQATASTSGEGDSTVPADTTVPAVTISSPAGGSTVSGTVTVNMAASDNVAVQKVELYLNGSLFGVIGAAPYSLTWNSASTPNGACTLRAKAYDAAGNIGESTVSLSVSNALADAAVPVVSAFAMPATSALLTVPVTTFTATDDIGVTGYFISESSTPPAATAAGWSASAPASFTFAAAGARTAYAWGKDAAGKVSAAKQAAVTISTNSAADTTAPIVFLTSPRFSSVLAGTVIITAVADDNVAVTKVEYIINGVVKGTSTSAPYNFSWDTLTVANGAYQVTARAYDAAGNMTLAEIKPVTVANAGDSVAPAVSLTSPANSSTVSGAVSVSANATDNVAVAKVEFLVNGVLQATSAAAPYGFTWNTAQLPNGSYALSARAYDAAGNVGQATNVLVTLFNDLVKPEVAITSPVAGTIDGTVAFAASASDNVAVTKVEFLVNGVLQATSAAAPFGFTWNTAQLPNGSYTLSARAYDAAGNVGQATNVLVTLFNDLVKPEVAITSPVAGTIGGTVAFAASASDNVAVQKVEFYLDGVLKATSTSAPYGFTLNTTAIANGLHTLSARAYDTAGNIGDSGSVSINVLNDSSAPSITSFAMPAVINSTTVEVTALSAMDDVGVAGYLITESATVPSPNAAGWSATRPASFTFAGTGSRTAYAWAKDAAGRVSAASSANVIIDTVLPLISGMTFTSGSTYVTVKASATDNIAVAKMQIYVDKVLQMETAESSLIYTWSPSARSSQQVTVKVYDVAGNVRTRSMNLTKF